jgi:signal transduction histidine kinase
MTPHVLAAEAKNDRWLRLGAIVVAALSLLMIAVNISVSAALGKLGHQFLPTLVTAISLAVVGGLIGARRPRVRIGWLLLFVAFTQGLVNLSGALSHLASDASVLVPGEHVFTWFSRWMWMPGLGVMVTYVVLLFPDGHLPSPRWRWLAIITGVALVVPISVLAITAWSVDSHALVSSQGPPQGSLAGKLLGPGVLLVGICALASYVSLIFRYRKSGPLARHQLKWFLFGTVLVAVVAASSFTPGPTEGPGVAALNIFITVAVLGLPASIAVAVLRYRLYDIDVVISRTLVYGSLAAFITAVYVGIVVGVGTLVGSGGQPNLALSIVATAIVAVAFQPVRERLQKIANRLIYGRRATPYEVLSQFSERVAETYAADEALPKMARVLAEGTGAERATVWLRSEDKLRAAASWPVIEGGPVDAALLVTGQVLPPIVGAQRAVAVQHQGDLLGALSVTKRAGESLTPIEENLLDDLAHQAGLVLKNVGLTAELLARLEELRASRQRLVAAQDEERRRLERNLHDGAQQNLVALKVKLGLAEMFAEKDPARARATLAELKTDTDEALETLRDLARGIYPPLLADKGLAAALESQARKATLPVEVEADGTGRYPQDIEAAVYFCVLEALQNVQKYAGASKATVRLRETDGSVTFEVADDGKGFDPATQKKGSGTQNMEDRLDALGGSIEVASAPGRGTSVRGSLLLEAPVPA